MENGLPSFPRSRGMLPISSKWKPVPGWRLRASTVYFGSAAGSSNNITLKRPTWPYVWHPFMIFCTTAQGGFVLGDTVPIESLGASGNSNKGISMYSNSPALSSGSAAGHIQLSVSENNLGAGRAAGVLTNLTATNFGCFILQVATS